MRTILTILALISLAGCSTAGLEKDQPVYYGQSAKTPQEFARCLAPKWQEFNSSTSSIETERGYRIAASAAFTGTVALAVVDKASGGSDVRVFLPVDWAGTKGWKDTARTCI